jgi:hypothetical protein
MLSLPFPLLLMPGMCEGPRTIFHAWCVGVSRGGGSEGEAITDAERTAVVFLAGRCFVTRCWEAKLSG